jgi:hypothetical protein
MNHAGKLCDILGAYDEHGMMVAAMMTAMMSNNHYLGHERRQDCQAGPGKKYCECN